jgi:hypothetical protein
VLTWDPSVTQIVNTRCVRLYIQIHNYSNQHNGMKSIKNIDTCLFISLISLTFQTVRVQEQLILYLGYTELTAAHT